MLDDFSIVTTSGIVLWRRSYAPVHSNVVNSLINDVFVEERQKSGAQETAVNPPYKKDKYTLKWTAAKDVGLVFVVGKSACDSIPQSRGIDVGEIGRLPESPALVLG
jgi:signal recognition particle receptor subunit alpha